MSDTNNTDQPDEKKKMSLQPNWLRPAFFTSLAFNLFVVGLLAAPLLLMPFKDHDRHGYDRDDREHGRERMGEMPASPERMMRRGLAALDPADRKKMRAMVMESLPVIKQRVKEMRQAKIELTKAMSADPYDEAKLMAAFNNMDQALLNIGRAARESMMKALADMPAEQRKRMATAMANMDGPGLRPRGDRRDFGDPDRARRFKERMEERRDRRSQDMPEADSDAMKPSNEAPAP